MRYFLALLSIAFIESALADVPVYNPGGNGPRNYCVEQAVDYIESAYNTEIKVTRVLFEGGHGKSERLSRMWVWTDLCDQAFAFNMRPIRPSLCTTHHVGRVSRYYTQVWAGCQ